MQEYPLKFSEELPDAMEVEVEGGEQFSIQFEYPWKPQRCFIYKTLGHPAKFCSRFTKTCVTKSNRANL